MENYFEGLNLAKLHRAGRRWDDLSFPEKNVKYPKVVQFLSRLQHFNQPLWLEKKKYLFFFFLTVGVLWSDNDIEDKNDCNKDKDKDKNDSRKRSAFEQ